MEIGKANNEISNLKLILNKQKSKEANTSKNIVFL